MLCSSVSAANPVVQDFSNKFDTPENWVSNLNIVVEGSISQYIKVAVHPRHWRNPVQTPPLLLFCCSVTRVYLLLPKIPIALVLFLF